MVTTKHSSLFHSHFLIFPSKTDLSFQSHSILFSLGTTHCFSKTCGHMDMDDIRQMLEQFRGCWRSEAELPALTKERLEEIKSSRLKAQALLAETQALIAKYPSDLCTAACVFHSDHVPDAYGSVESWSEKPEGINSRISRLGLIIKEFDLMMEEICLTQKNLEEKQKSIRCKRNALRKEHSSFIEEVEALNPQLQKEVETIHNECLFELEKLVESASIFSTLLAPLEEDHVRERIVGIEEREMTMMMTQPCEA